MRLLDDGCAIVFQSSKNCVDFRFASDIVSERITSVSRDTIGRHTHVFRQLVVRPKGEHNSVQIKKDNPRRAWLRLPTDDALVESHGTLQISDTECDQAYSLFHVSSHIMIFNITITREIKVDSTITFDEHDRV